MRLYTCLESFKEPPLNMKYKICRGISYLCYIVVSFLENLYIRLVPFFCCRLNTAPRNEKIIVSLTSYPGRIHIVHLTIKSLMIQTERPDKIILWLYEGQFPNRILPDKLEKLKRRGLEVRYTSVDYKSHKKYFIALQEQKRDELVITFDDDIIYDPLCIKRAIETHSHYPNSIVVNQALQITVCDGEIGAYSTWHAPTKKQGSSFKLMPLTGSGCLYPYGVLNECAFDWYTILQTSLSTDDLWIKFVSIISGTPVVETTPRAKIFTTVYSSQKNHLAITNLAGGGNNNNVQLLISKFPDTLKVLTNDM